MDLLLPIAEIGHETSSVITTLSLALAAGGILSVLAKRLRIPGIVFLLLGGVCLGPEGINIIQPDTLGSILNVLVAVAIGLILFEGGLTLDIGGYKTAPKVIRNLLTFGVLLTWLLVSLTIWALFQTDISFALLAASLVVVTGPTVIQPILKRINLKWNLHNILHWEGVLIDPIGVFLAVLTFEWVVGGAGEEALINLLIRIVGGLFIGFVGGELISWLLKKKFIPEDMINVFMVAAAMSVFGLTELLIAEGGLLSVTVAGLICGSRQPPAIKSIVEFKSVLTDILIGFIFILLTARLELQQFLDFGTKGFILVGIVMLVIRPLTIWVCTIGTELQFKEKLFLGWVAPRGVVAASMASLFALSLINQNKFTEYASFLESFVYSIIFATVLLQGFSAAPLAKLLKLLEKNPDGWLIVGAHPVAREIANFLKNVRKIPVLLIDGNRRAVVEAQQAGLNAFFADARETSAVENRDEMRGIGKLLAFTDNEDLNELLCKKWEPTFGKENVHRWASVPSSEDAENATGKILWSWMPKPSMMSSELMLGEAALIERNGERLKNPGNLSALLTANGKEVLLDPGPTSKLKNDKDVEPKTLYLQREADYLLNALNPKWVLRLNPKSKEEVFRKLVERLVEEKESLSADDLYDQIMERENAAPTTLGHGVAVPHAKIDGLESTLCFIAQIPEGLDFYGDDSEKVKIVFMLISPPDMPEMHLAVLGEIARICAEEEVREKIMEIEDPNEVIGTIRLYRRQHTPFADARG